MPTLTFLLPRDRFTGLNNVMQLLARRRGEPVIFVADSAGYSVARTISLFHALRRLKREGMVVHSSGLVPDLMNALTGCRGSSTTLHNYLAADYTLQYGRLKGVVAALLHRLALGRLSLVVACSQAVSAHLAKAYRLRSTVCVNGCVDTSTTRDGEGSLHPRIYSFAGPLIERKNVTATVDAIRRGDPDATINVFGSGAELESVTSANQGHAAFRVGSVACPAVHYQRAHFYFSFARFEGMPLSVLEAVKAELIPVLSSIPPHEEVLALLGVDGLACFDTPDAGVRWATSLSDRARNELASRVARRAWQVFSEEAFVARFDECLRTHFED